MSYAHGHPPSNGYAPPAGPPPPRFPAPGSPPRQPYAAPPPPSQIWNAPLAPPSRTGTPAQVQPSQPAWGPPPQQWRPPQPAYGPPPAQPIYGRPPMGMGGPGGFGGMGAPQFSQRHVGPSGPNGSFLTSDLIAEPEIMLNEEQLKIWKTFDNKEIDREGLKVSFWQKFKSGTLDWGKWWNDQMKWKNMKKWIIVLISLAISIALLIEQKHIINALKPPMEKLKTHSWGWALPAGVLFVLSFPPLIGAEIVVILVAIAWNIMPAWGITTAGTLAGEVANYWLWMWIMRNRQAKAENASLYWAKLSKVSRDGGFLMCLAIRYSLIPTHLSTTLFAACGVNFPVYIAATVLSQPRWLFHVFVGRTYGTTDESNTEKIIFAAVSLLFAVSTQLAMKWINKKEDACDADVKDMLRARRADALNAVRTRLPQEIGHKRSSSSLSTILGGDIPAPKEVAMYNMGPQGHRRNESNASFASSSETAVGSTAYLGQYKEEKH